MKNNYGAMIMVVFCALLLSGGGAAIKSSNLTVWQISSFRAGIAALFLLIAIPSARRWNRRVMMVGCCYAIVLTLFVVANRFTTAVNTIFLQDTAPLYVMLLSPMLLKERVGKREFLMITVFGAGIALSFLGADKPTSAATNPMLGNLLGAVLGIFWGLNIMGIRWLESNKDKGDSGAASTCVGCVLCFLFTLPFAEPIANPFWEIAFADWLLLIFLGVFAIGLAFYLLGKGMKGVTALEASLILLLEPILNPLWTWLTSGEIPTPLSLAGAGLILGATILYAVSSGAQKSIKVAEPATAD